MCFYLERPDSAAWTAALRWISSEPERCNSGSLSPEQTGRTADPRSAWPALDTDRQSDGRSSGCLFELINQEENEFTDFISTSQRVTVELTAGP